MTATLYHGTNETQEFWEDETHKLILLRLLEDASWTAHRKDGTYSRYCGCGDTPGEAANAFSTSVVFSTRKTWERNGEDFILKAVPVKEPTLAKDLSDFILKYAPALAKTAESKLIPLFDPAKQPLPDLSALEQNRTKKAGHKFHFYPSQKEKVAGAYAGLKESKRAWFVCEMGCGKTPMSLAATHLLFNGKPYHVLVMCPPHLVHKWVREAQWLIPNVHAVAIKSLADLKALPKNGKKPVIAVISRETAKLGFDVNKPAAMRRISTITGKGYDVPDGAIVIDERETYERGGRGWVKVYTWRVNVPVAACPLCGEIIKDKEDVPITHADYTNGEKIETCKCGERLATCARGHRSNMHLDRYVQRKMRGYFDVLIADEAHELAGSNTCQGNALGTLASACKYVMALTGTLIGGKAIDLHAILWRMTPQRLVERGFHLKDSIVSSISRNEKHFVQRYGVIETQTIRDVADDIHANVRWGRSGRKKDFKVKEIIKPGISPDLFNHFLLQHGVFMSLSELGPALPTLDRRLVKCQMSEPLKTAYCCVDSDLQDAMRERNNGNGPPTVATLRIMVLDAYLDRPYSWEPVTAPTYDAGIRTGDEVVCVPPDLGSLHEDDKDAKLLEIVRLELEEGRKCAIYCQYTGVHDVRPKLLAMLKRNKVRVVALPDTVTPVKREAWIAEHEKDIDVLVVHPKRVMTGLDLLGFPSLIWYQVGYSTHVLRQASARARRPAQTKPCRVYYFYYEGTIQEQAMALMGEKEAASQALEGVFDTAALKAMMNGGEGDDILSALAHGVQGVAMTFNADKAWQFAQTQPPQPEVKPQEPESEWTGTGDLFEIPDAPDEPDEPAASNIIQLPLPVERHEAAELFEVEA